MQFHGAKVTLDAGLLVVRELDKVLGLTKLAEVTLVDTRTGRNVGHDQVALHSWLARYEDTNDAERLAVDLAMLAIAFAQALPAARTGRYGQQLIAGSFDRFHPPGEDVWWQVVTALA